MAAHELRYLYRRGRDLPDARRRLHDVLSRCVFSDVPELLRLARTLDAWREELLAYFTTSGLSNGPTEAVNLLIKRIKRVGFGFRNFDNYRLRLLLHCGIDWHTPTATPIRGRPPRLARRAGNPAARTSPTPGVWPLELPEMLDIWVS
jgi:hypothetical protein